MLVASFTFNARDDAFEKGGVWEFDIQSEFAFLLLNRLIGCYTSRQIVYSKQPISIAALRMETTALTSRVLFKGTVNCGT